MSTTKQHIAYDSNPFTTGLTAVKKLFSLNSQALVGVTLSIFVASAALGMSAIGFWFATTFFLTRGYANSGGIDFPQPLEQLFNGMPDGLAHVLWGGSLVVAVLFAALVQALQLCFTIETARGVTISFRQVLRTSFKYILPLMGLAGLALLAVFVFLIVIGALAAAAPAIVFLLGAATVALVVFVSLRLAFASYSIVDKNLGPINALKYSWRVTDGRLIDIAGTAALAAILFIVPGIIFGALAKVSEGIAGLVTTFDILNLVFQIALIVIAAVPIAERYVQSVAVHNKEIEPTPTSPFNFLAIALIFVLMPVYDALTVPTEPVDPYDSFGVPSLEESAQPSGETPQGSSRAY